MYNLRFVSTNDKSYLIKHILNYVAVRHVLCNYQNTYRIILNFLFQYKKKLKEDKEKILVENQRCGSY